MEFFNLQRTVDTEFFPRVSGHQIFLVTPNLRLKSFQNFFLYRALWSLNFTEGVWYQLFLVTLNLKSKIFWIFPFTEHCGLWIFCRGWSGHQLFLGTPNLKSKIFRNFFLYQALWTEFFREGSGPTFFGDAKFDLKKLWEFFALSSALDFEFVGRGGSCHQHFSVMPNLRSKIFRNFFIYTALWTLNFFKGRSRH